MLQRGLAPYESFGKSNILDTEIQTAARIAKLVFDSKLARVEEPRDKVAFIRQHVYVPEYTKEAELVTRVAKEW